MELVSTDFLFVLWSLASPVLVGQVIVDGCSLTQAERWPTHLPARVLTTCVFYNLNAPPPPPQTNQPPTTKQASA